MTAQPHDSRLDPSHSDALDYRVESGQITPQAIELPTPDVPLPAGHQTAPSTTCCSTPIIGMSAEHPTSPPAIPSASTGPALPVVDPLLFVHVTAHSDLEQIRIASDNRLRILTATEPDDDGVVRGFGLDPSHPDVARLEGITEALRAIEHGAELNLKRALRKCAIHPWVKAQVGLGEKQVARLLGAIGDPYWHLAEDRPRTVSELWAYCGLHVLPASHRADDTQTCTAGGVQLPAGQLTGATRGTSAGGDQPPATPRETDTHSAHGGGNQTSDPGHIGGDTHRDLAGVAARRRKGQKANWSTEAKTRAYLIAASCIKQAKSPYRATYDARRAHTAVTHPDWTLGHSHNDALRITSKAVLRDLWRESKRLHEVAES